MTQATVADALLVTARTGESKTRGRSKIWRRLALAAGGAAVAAGLAIGVRQALVQRGQPVHYETATVGRNTISAKVTANGAVSALVTVTIGSQVSGKIEWLGADFGSHVEKGQKIATIDASLFRAAAAQTWANQLAAKASVSRADADLLQAQRRYERTKSLADGGVLSVADLETAEAALGVAKAARVTADAEVARAAAASDQAQLNLKYTVIYSPIDGVVISRSVDVGQTVAATLQSPTLFTVAQDLTHMQVDTNVAEADVGKISPGMTATFTVDAYPSRIFTGTVRQVRDAAQTIQNVVTYDAVIDVDNADRLLKPGMTANVTFVHATHEDVLAVPNAALRFKPDDATLAMMTSAAAPKPDLHRDQRTIWVARSDGSASKVIVRVGLTDGTSTEVLDGPINPGDRVVVEAGLTPIRH